MGLADGAFSRWLGIAGEVFKQLMTPRLQIGPPKPYLAALHRALGACAF